MEETDWRVLDEIPPTVAEADRNTVRILRQIRAELAERGAAAEAIEPRSTPSRREWYLEGVIAAAFGIINHQLIELGSW